MNPSLIWAPLLAIMSAPEASVEAQGARIVAACNAPAYCGFERPEDIAEIPGSDWMIVSQAGDEPLVLFYPKTDHRKPVAWESSRQPQRSAHPQCGDAPQDIEARGNSAAMVNGTRLFAVINQHDQPRIELFEIKGNGQPRLEWAGCIAIPDIYQLNDIALAANGTIFASHMFDLPTGPNGFEKLRADFLARTPTGFAVRWDHTDGWARVPGTDVSFANGIAVSNDGMTLAVGGTYEQALVLVDRASGSATRIDLNLQPDNITPYDSNGFMTVGYTGVPMSGIEPCRADPLLPCAFPFAVAAMVPVSGRYDTELVYEQQGLGSIPGASVAVPWNSGLLLGTSFGDRITPVPLSQADGAP